MNSLEGVGKKGADLSNFEKWCSDRIRSGLRQKELTKIAKFHRVLVWQLSKYTNEKHV